MRVWLTSFILLFGAAELFQWARELSLPLPIFVLGGVFLAVASNYNKLKNLPFHLDYEEPPSKELPSEPAKQPIQTKELHNKPTRSISFEIRKPYKPVD